MKKKTALTTALLIALGVLSVINARNERQVEKIIPENTEVVSSSAENDAAQSITSVSFIGEEKAKEVSSQKAEISSNIAEFKKSDLIEKDGVWKYEIEFTHNEKNYFCDVNAENGEIIKWEVRSK